MGSSLLGVTLICINGLLKEAVLRFMDGSCCEWRKSKLNV